MRPYRYCPRCATPLQKTERDGHRRFVCPDADCRFVYWNNPVPVVAAIAEHPDGVVLVQNKGWPASWYGLVSGFLEAREEPAAAVLREVQEEIGLDGRVISMVGLYTFEQMNQLIIAYHVEVEGTVVQGDELENHKIVPVDKLKAWSIGTGPALQDWLDERRGAASDDEGADRQQEK